MYVPDDLETASILAMLRAAPAGPRRITLMRNEAARLVALIDALAAPLEPLRDEMGIPLEGTRSRVNLDELAARKISHWVLCGEDCESMARCPQCPVRL